MVQMMNCRPKVKLEAADPQDYHHLPKRSKLDSVSQGSLENGEFPIPPALYNPLDEPSPLGLRLKKSPSFLDLIEMRLSQQNAPKLATLKKKGAKGNAISIAAEKLKASNFPASILKIGTWEYKSRYEGDLVAKCYFAKHKLVWETLDGDLKNKIEIQWSDIVAIKANCSDDEPGTLDIVLARQPLFFRETNPQPRKHTLWKATSDFTGGQASLHRRHFLQCSPDLLGKHFEKLIQCDPRLSCLSQQPEILLESQYFEPKASLLDDLNGPTHVSGFEIGIPTAFPAVQTSSSIDEHGFIGRGSEDVCRATLSPSSVIESNAVEELGSSGNMRLKREESKVLGIHSSMSMIDLMGHIEHCISEQRASGNPMFSEDSLQGRDVVGEIVQYLFSDSQLVSASEEQIMSIVNSLCCLLQKDSPTGQSWEALEASNSVEGCSDTRIGESKRDGDFKEPDGESEKQLGSMSRKDSISDLLLNLPRIASLPQFLFSISEDSETRS